MISKFEFVSNEDSHLTEDISIFGPISVIHELTPEYIERTADTFFSNHRPGRSIFVKLANNLMKPSHQQAALAVLKKGEMAIKSELAARGIATTTITNSEMGLGFHEIFFRYIHGDLALEISIPIEVGDFGKDHGELSHAAQYLAMTTEMNPAELEEAKLFLGSMSQTAANHWPLWMILFDSAEGPNSPRWWKNR